MKKLFAILSAVAIFTGTLPVVMASGLDGLTTDEIIMDMGDANVVATFGGTDASAALATWTGTAVESDYAHNGTYYEYKPTTTTDDTTTISIVYTPQNLTAGDYEVFANVPESHAAGIKATVTYGEATNELKYSQNNGYNNYHSLGKYTFTGNGTENVKIEFAMGAGNTGFAADSVKLVKMTAITEPISKLVLEENGLGRVNDSETYTNCGYTNFVYNGTNEEFSWGASGAKIFGHAVATYSNGQIYRTVKYSNWNEIKNIQFKYYPKLNAGKYNVTVNVPAISGVTAAGIKVTAGDKSRSFGYGSAGKAINRALGTVEFSGVYGEDCVTVQRYNGNGTPLAFDTVTFERVYDEPIGKWSFESGSVEDTVTTYDWAEVAGNKVSATTIGLSADGIKVADDTSGDMSAVSALKLELPVTTKTFTINMWARTDSTTKDRQRLFYMETGGDSSHNVLNTTLYNGYINSQFPDKATVNTTSSTDNWIRAMANADGAAYKPSIGDWHMYTTTYKVHKPGDTTFYSVKTYVDGVLVGERDISSIPTDLHKNLSGGIPAGALIYIGGDFSNKYNFRGVIDDVSIYNSTLGELDIKALYNSSKQALPTATDSEITLVNGLELGTKDNSASFTTTGIAESTYSYEASATVGNTFKNEYIVIENIPTGLFVSKVVTGNNVTTVTFDGALTTAAKDDKTMSLYFMPYGTYNANSNAQDVTVKTGYELESTGSIAADTCVYTATVTNNSYGATDTVDVVVAVYDSSKRMKDVCLKKGITTTEGEKFTVTTDALQYKDGDAVRMFIFDSISTIQPVNALIK